MTHLCDAVCHKAALGVIDQAEVLVGPVNLNDIHEAGRVRAVRPHFAVHLHQALHEDGNHLLACQRIPA